MNPDEFHGDVGFFVGLQAKLDDFAHIPHEAIEALRLRVAAVNLRDARDVIAFVAPDNHREFFLSPSLFPFHAPESSTSQWRKARTDVRE